MRSTLLLFILFSFGLHPSMKAAVIYSGLKNLAIPTNFDGIYLDLDTGTTSSSEISGWDANFFFGGVGIAYSLDFHPTRYSEDISTVVLVGVNDLISGAQLYAMGENGSSEHLGAAGNFQDGVEGYLGFHFTKNNATGPFYGWIRLTLTGNTSGALIHDWAWEDNGGAILAGAQTAIPEPSPAILMLLGLFHVVVRRKRQTD